MAILSNNGISRVMPLSRPASSGAPQASQSTEGSSHPSEEALEGTVPVQHLQHLQQRLKESKAQILGVEAQLIDQV